MFPPQPGTSFSLHGGAPGMDGMGVTMTTNCNTYFHPHTVWSGQVVGVAEHDVGVLSHADATI